MWVQHWDVANNNHCNTKASAPWHFLHALLAGDTRLVMSSLLFFVGGCQLRAMGRGILKNRIWQKKWFFSCKMKRSTKPILQITQPTSPLTTHTQVLWPTSPKAKWLKSMKYDRMLLEKQCRGLHKTSRRNKTHRDLKGSFLLSWLAIFLGMCLGQFTNCHL